MGRGNMMMMNIDETLELHNIFFQRVGSVEAAATLALVHTLRQTRSEPAAPEFLTAAEAAEVLGVSADTIYDLCASGRLRHARIGGKGRGVIRIRRGDLAKIESESTQDVDPGLALFKKHCS